MSGPKRKLSLENEIEILRLWDEDKLTARAIATKLDVNGGSVWWQLKRHGRIGLPPTVTLGHEELVAKMEAEKVRQEHSQRRQEGQFKSNAVKILLKIEDGLKKFSLDANDAEACLAFTKAADMTLERHRRVLGLPDPPKSRARKD